MGADAVLVDQAPTVLRGFRAMGSDAHLIVLGGDHDLAAWAEARIAELEGRWSRFLPTSEISALNAAAGRWVAVSPETALLVERAVEAWRLTAGRVDATVLGAVLRAGYDADFADLANRPPAPRGGLRIGGCADIRCAAGSARLPAEVGFDPGGIGKGLAADLVAAELLDAGATGCLVNVGGDLRALGASPTEAGWVVTVPDPFRPDEELLRAALSEGGAATSSRLERRWHAGGTEMHHLIDPFTGAPADGEIVAATVVAAQAWEAEVLVKAVTVGGTAGFHLLGGAAAVAVTTSGEHLSANLSAGVLR
jgi:thiamine biosynthesis lipoprotein